MSNNIAVVGATGNVGREMLNILSDKNYDAKNIFPVASEIFTPLIYTLSVIAIIFTSFIA